MQYVPHYREHLLRQLGEHCALTVTALPCSNFDLIEPEHRQGYEYIEGGASPALERFGVRWMSWERAIVRQGWDVIICTEDLHFPHRYVMFMGWLVTRRGRPRWIWWGHFQGRSRSRALRRLRSWLVKTSDGALTYTEEIRARLIAAGCPPDRVVSANNSEVLAADVQPLPPHTPTDRLNVLFVGRNIPHKRVDRLIEAAGRLPFLRVRLVGPGMERLEPLVSQAGVTERVELHGVKTGDRLLDDLDWCHLVASPGHLGLLVATAARAGRPIVVDSSSEHAPEAVIARGAEQPFIDFSSPRAVDRFFTQALDNAVPLADLGSRLAEHVRTSYTIEESVRRIRSLL
jgi:glycosyltransferase involved in cell wall biosynthesis